MIFYLFFIATIFSLPTTIDALSFEDIKNTFSKTPKEQRVIHKEFPVKGFDTLFLRNTQGNITIKTWDTSTIVLKAHIKTQDPQDAQAITIREKKYEKTFALSPLCPSKCTVDLELMVPSHLTLDIATKIGNINLKELCKSATIQTQAGNIELHQSKEAVNAHIIEKGTLILKQAHGPVQAINKNGNIAIIDAHQSVQARCTKGNITLKSIELPSTSVIDLQTSYGTIATYLPPEVNAELQASSHRGNVTCNSYITLKPRTTKLDKDAWQRIKKEVDGTFGSGEARICLQAESNIKIDSYSIT